MTYAIPNVTGTGGAEDILRAEAAQIPALPGAILFFIFIVIAGAGYYSQERKTGAGNFPMWGAIAGLITTAGSFALFLYDNLVNIETMIISLVVTIIFAFFFLVSERD